MIETDAFLSPTAMEVAAKAVADHHAHRLDMPDDPNGPMDEDWDVAQAVLVAIVAAAERGDLACRTPTGDDAEPKSENPVSGEPQPQ